MKNKSLTTFAARLFTKRKTSVSGNDCGQAPIADYIKDASLSLSVGIKPYEPLPKESNRSETPVVLISGISLQKCSDAGEEKKQADEDSLDEFHIFLGLLESRDYDENRGGLERLIYMVNTELVNSAKINESMAHVLACGGPQSDDNRRLRAAFLSFFCNKDHTGVSSPEVVGIEAAYSDDDRDVRLMDADFDQAGGKHNGALRLPALRALTSSLELLASSKGEGPKLDLESNFWKLVITSLSNMVENVEARRIDAALSIRCLRLLWQVETPLISSLIRYSLFPCILHAKDVGNQTRYRMLVKEVDALLGTMGLLHQKH
jgi:hypothetical protein